MALCPPRPPGTRARRCSPEASSTTPRTASSSRTDSPMASPWSCFAPPSRRWGARSPSSSGRGRGSSRIWPQSASRRFRSSPRFSVALPAEAGCQPHAGAEPGDHRASSGTGGAPPLSEDGGHRFAGRRGRPQLQQYSADDQHPHLPGADEAGPPGPKPGESRAGGRGNPAGRTPASLFRIPASAWTKPRSSGHSNRSSPPRDWAAVPPSSTRSTVGSRSRAPRAMGARSACCFLSPSPKRHHQPRPPRPARPLPKCSKRASTVVAALAILRAHLCHSPAR